MYSIYSYNILFILYWTESKLVQKPGDTAFIVFLILILRIHITSFPNYMQKLEVLLV